MEKLESKKKSRKLILGYLILLFSFFKPRSLSVFFPTINLVYNYFPYISFLFVFYMILKNNKVSKIIYFISIYFIILLFTTILNNGDFNNSLNIVFRVISLCLIVDYGIKKNPREFLNALEFILYILIVINFFSLFLFPKGMYIDASGYKDNWFLGYKNILILFILPALCVSYINAFYKYGKLKKRNYLLLIVSLISLFIADSSTSLIGIALFVILYMFKNIFKKANFLNIKFYALSSLVLFFSVVIFKIQSYFAFIIENIFHRDVTLTGRTYIWNYVIDFIKSKPILGYGIENSIVRLNKTNYLRTYHAHNQFLEVVYQTGIIGVISMMVIIYKSFKELYIYRDNNISKILSITIFIFSIMMLTEAYSYEYFMYLFVLCYNIKYLIKSKNI